MQSNRKCCVPVRFILFLSVTGDLFKSSCSLDLTAFPWDHQNCLLELIVWGYKPKEVKIQSSLDVYC